MCRMLIKCKKFRGNIFKFLQKYAQRLSLIPQYSGFTPTPLCFLHDYIIKRWKPTVNAGVSPTKELLRAVSLRWCITLSVVNMSWDLHTFQGCSDKSDWYVFVTCIMSYWNNINLLSHYMFSSELLLLTNQFFFFSFSFLKTVLGAFCTG